MRRHDFYVVADLVREEGIHDPSLKDHKDQAYKRQKLRDHKAALVCPAAAAAAPGGPLFA